MVRWASNFLGGTRMRRYLLPVSVVSSALFVAWSALGDPPQPAPSAAATATPAPPDTTKGAVNAVPLGKGKVLFSAKVLKEHTADVAPESQVDVAAHNDPRHAPA